MLFYFWLRLKFLKILQKQTWRLVISFFMLFVNLIIPTSFAEANERKSKFSSPSFLIDQETKDIPQYPKAPPQLFKGKFKDYSICQRFVTYQDQRFECDSFLGKDGEALRPLIKDVPYALDELNHYQQNRINAQKVAYLGTAGVLAIISGVITRNYNHEISNIILFSGIGVTLGAAGYGFFLLNGNESHLNSAIHHHNVAYPDRPIRSEF